MSTITRDLALALSKDCSVTVLSSRPCRPYGYVFTPVDADQRKEPFSRVIMDSFTYPKSAFWGRLRENISFGKNAVAFIDKHASEYDVVYLNVFALFAQQMIIKCANKHHLAVINHLEDIYPEPFIEKIPLIGGLVYRFLLPIDRWNVRHATCSIVIGAKIKEYYLKTRSVNAQKIEVVYNWQDENRFRGEFPYPWDGFIFLYAGSVSKATGLRSVIEAFGESGLQNARLVIAGSGTEKAAMKQLAESYVGADIQFIDAPVNRIEEIQSSADVLILPLKKGISLRAVPSKFSAYLMSGRAVLAFVEPDSDVSDIINKSGCGWHAIPGDKREMINGFVQAFSTDKRLLQQMGKNGRAYYFNHLSKEYNLSRLVGIIKQSEQNDR